jgi:hypothetical protein
MILDNKQVKERCLEATCQNNLIVCKKGLGYINLGDETSLCIASYFEESKLTNNLDKMYDCLNRVPKN